MEYEIYTMEEQGPVGRFWVNGHEITWDPKLQGCRSVVEHYQRREGVGPALMAELKRALRGRTQLVEVGLTQRG